MNRSLAYLLIAHGSRDPRPHQAVDSLARAFCEQLSQRTVEQAKKTPIPKIGATSVANAHPLTPVVGTATLELGMVPLHEQIAHFARRSADAGHRCINLVPLFLLSGVHVMDDLPTHVAIAQPQIPAGVELRLMPHIGASLRMSHLVQFSDAETTARVLLAHGTKRPSGNQPIEAIAAYHRAKSAYWSVEPSLSDCVQTLIHSGYNTIEIQPYFLFPGGITDAIAQQVESLATEFSAAAFHVLPPLGMTPALADILLEMAIAPESSRAS